MLMGCLFFGVVWSVCIVVNVVLGCSKSKTEWGASQRSVVLTDPDVDGINDGSWDSERPASIALARAQFTATTVSNTSFLRRWLGRLVGFATPDVDASQVALSVPEKSSWAGIGGPVESYHELASADSVGTAPSALAIQRRMGDPGSTRLTVELVANPLHAADAASDKRPVPRCADSTTTTTVRMLGHFARANVTPVGAKAGVPVDISNPLCVDGGKSDSLTLAMHFGFLSSCCSFLLLRHEPSG